MEHKKITIKFSYPPFWDNLGGDFLAQTQGRDGVWGRYKFEINNHVKKCDYWFVCEDHSIYFHDTAFCPPENCILITNEEKSMWDYPIPYLKQFGKILTSRDDIQHKCAIRTQHLAPWHIKRNYDFLKNCSVPIKKCNLSSVTSNAVFLEGHIRRYKLLNRLKGHFKDKLHWFGRGERPLEDKWDGIAPYRYSIAIENSAHIHYFTEKILDCYLAFTMPIYWGCPNILDYFPKESLILIEDIDDYKKSILQIESAVDEGKFDNNFNYILQARKLTLDKYQVFAFLGKWLDDQEQNTKSAKNILIKSKAYYQSNLTLKQKIYSKYQYFNLRFG